MKAQTPRSTYRWLPAVIALALALISCRALTPQAETPTPERITPPLVTDAPPVLPTVEVAPTEAMPTVTADVPPPVVAPTPWPTVTPEPAADLTPNGPWLLINMGEGLWATNADGSALTQLTNERVVGPNDLSLAVQPGGRLVAYITGDADHTHNLTLKLLSLPDGGTKTITRLTNAGTEPGNEAMLDSRIEAVRAIADFDSLAWSPDGSMLAFIGVQDGPTADLYTYSAGSGEIRRLTDGPSQGYGPHWSPDGRFIVHFGVNSFGTGAGFSMAGGWAAWASGAGVKTLFTGGGSGQEFAGWVNDRQFLINAWRPDCGPQNLRVMDVETGTARTLVEGCFSSAAAAPFNGKAFVAGGMDGADFHGLWMVDTATGTRVELQPDSTSWVTTQSVFPDVLAMGSSGTVIFSSDGTRMADSPPAGCTYGYQTAGYGMIYAWACSEVGPEPGLWINGPGIETRKIFEGGAGLPMWSPDNTLLFVSGQTLYKALFFQYDPVPVGIVTGDISAMAWVGVQ